MTLRLPTIAVAAAAAADDDNDVPGGAEVRDFGVIGSFDKPNGLDARSIRGGNSGTIPYNG